MKLEYSGSFSTFGISVKINTLRMNLTKRKKVILSIIAILCLAVLIFSILKFTNKFGHIDKQLQQEAREKNRTCPQYVDQETRLDNTTALSGNIFQYNYTLVRRVKDSIQVEELRTYLEPSILNNIRTNPDLRYQRDNNVILNFNYKDKHGAFVLKISITPEMYLK